MVKYYSNFQYYYGVLYIHYLPLVEFERWSANVVFFPSSTPTATFHPDLYLAWSEGSGVQTRRKVGTHLETQTLLTGRGRVWGPEGFWGPHYTLNFITTYCTSEVRETTGVSQTS